MLIMACKIKEEVKKVLGDASNAEIDAAVSAVKKYAAEDKEIDSARNEQNARSVMGSMEDDKAYFDRLEAAIANPGVETDGITFIPGSDASLGLLDGVLDGAIINEIINNYKKLGIQIPEAYIVNAMEFMNKVKGAVTAVGGTELSHNFAMFNSTEEHSKAFWVNKAGIDENGNIDGGKIFLINGTTDRPISTTGELLFHELTHSATEAGLNSNTKLLRQVSRVQREVMKQLTPEILLSHLKDPTKAEKDRAQEIIRYMNGDPSEFLAYAISNPNVFMAMQKMNIRIDTFKINKEDSNAFTAVFDKIKEILNDIISVITNGPTAASALKESINEILVRNVNAKARIYDGDMFNDYDQFVTGGRFGKIDKFMKDGSEKIGEKLDRLMESTATTRAGLSSFLDAVGEVQGFRQFRDSGVMQSIAHTVFRSTTNREFAGLFQIIRKVKADNDKEQNTLKEANANLVNSWFKGVDAATRSAVTDLLAVDPNALDMDRVELAELFESPVVLNAKINKLVSEIGVNEYLHQARDLGWYMIHGESKSRILQTNAHRIYYRMWNGEKNPPLIGDIDGDPAKDSDMIDKINQLTTLFAIKYVDQRNKDLIVKLMKDENAIAISTDGTNTEGIHVVDLAMQHYESTRQEELRQFEEYANVLDKGWLRKAYSREKKARIVPEDLLRSMVERGWGEKGKVDGGAKYSAAATEMRGDGKKYYIMFADDYSASRTQGAIHDVGYFDQVQQMKDIYEEGQDGFEENIELVKNYRTTLSKDANVWADFVIAETDDMMKRDNHLMAVMKVDGTIVDYSVPISRADAQEHLALDRDIASVLAATITHRSAKVRSISNNVSVINKLLADEKEHANDDNYITISKDGEYAKEYAKIPEYTRDYIFAARKRFGLEGHPHSLVIHKDMLDDLVGYKDYSFAAEFKLGENGKYFDMKNHPIMALQVEKIEYFLKKIISRYKTVLVILNPATIAGNAWSNMVVASIHGIDPKTYTRKFIDHWKNIEDYNEVHNELIKLKSEKEAGFKGLDNRIEGLERRLRINPMHKLMKDGQFNMIIEDIDVHDNKEDHVEYYKRILLEKVIGTKGGKAAIEATENGLLTKNSGSFKVIEKLTAYNDLINRMIVQEKLEFELNQELANGSDMTNEEYASRQQDILNYVDQLFVNYSYLDNRYIKYANDMGLVLFTKYFFRSMKTLKQVYDKKPLALTAFLGFDNFVYDAVGDPWEGVFDIENKLETKVGPTAQFDLWSVMEKVFLPAPTNMF